MEAQLQELIEQIKEEGVATAKQKAEQIVSEAEAKAAAIITEAEARATAIRQEAEQDIARKEGGSRAALEQAGRDLLLATRTHIEKVCTSLLQGATEKNFSGDTLAELVFSSVNGFLANGAQGEILLDDSRYKELAGALHQGLQEKIEQGLVITPQGESRPGFTLSLQNGAAYIEVSDKELVELLKPYVKRYLADLLDQAVTE